MKNTESSLNIEAITPEVALAVLCREIGGPRWPGLLELMRILLQKDNKRVVDEHYDADALAVRLKVSVDVARKVMARVRTFAIGKRRFVTEQTVQRDVIGREA